MENFVITPEIIASINIESIDATANALKEGDLFHLPYDEVNVIIPFLVMTKPEKYMENKSCLDKWYYRFNSVSKEGFLDVDILESRGTRRWKNLTKENSIKIVTNVQIVRAGKSILTENITKLLIVLLATINCDKQFVQKSNLPGKKGNDLVSFPITKLTVKRKSLQKNETCKMGRLIRPHLRRGHIRNQAYGKNRGLRKKIFVPSTFVLADAEFVSSRKEYRI